MEGDAVRVMQDEVTQKNEEMKAKPWRKSADLLREAERERECIVWEWKELQRFLRDQEEILLRSLEELEKDILARQDRELSRNHPTGREPSRGSLPAKQKSRRTDNGKSRAFPKTKDDFAALENRLKRFAEKRVILQEILLMFKELFKVDLVEEASSSFLNGGKEKAASYTQFLCSCRTVGEGLTLSELARVRKMAGGNREEEMAKTVTFEEVAVHFCPGELSLLNPQQRVLYREVMQENYENVTSLVLALACLRPKFPREEEDGNAVLLRSSQSSEKGEQHGVTIPALGGNRKKKEKILPAEDCEVFQDALMRKEKEPHLKKNTASCPRRSKRQRKAIPKTGGEEIRSSPRDCQVIGNILLQRRIDRGRRQKICPKCGKGFSQRLLLLKHKRIHTRKTPYQCSYCGKIFSQRSHLSKHENSHKKEKRFKCSECGKTFHRSSHLSSHRRTHTGIKPYSCSGCGKSFSRGPDLRRHQKSHTGEKLHKCLDCGKSFGLHSTLIKHERIHTGEKPYKCSDCRKTFSQRSHLIVHKRIHTRDRPFKCSVCGAGFIQKAHLISHRRTHTGEKPFSCAKCGKSFKRNSTRVKHEKNHRKRPEAQPASLPTLRRREGPTWRSNSRNVQRVEKAAA